MAFNYLRGRFKGLYSSLQKCFFLFFNSHGEVIILEVNFFFEVFVFYFYAPRQHYRNFRLGTYAIEHVCLQTNSLDATIET